jgi:hypothetical protein
VFASRFVKEAKEQMGAEVFILVGYLDEKGKIQKAKWVLRKQIQNHLIYHLIFAGYRRQVPRVEALVMFLGKSEAMFGRNGVNI